MQRLDLAEEAIRLVRILRRLLPADREVAGLLALMLLVHARREARTGPDGEVVLLDEQDRGRWDRTMIEEGLALAPNPNAYTSGGGSSRPSETGAVAV